MKETKLTTQEIAITNQAVVLTKDEAERFEMLDEVKRNITVIQDKYDGLAQLIAGQLYLASENKLFELEGYTGIGKWAEETFNISSGTASDAIGVFKRFGNREDMLSIDPKYSAFNFSSLISMKKLTDEQIKLLKITPDMTRKEIKAKVSQLAMIESKEASRSILIKAFNSAIASLSSKGWTKKEMRQYMEFTLEYDPAIQINDMDIELAEKFVEDINAWNDSSADDLAFRSLLIRIMTSTLDESVDSVEEFGVFLKKYCPKDEEGRIKKAHLLTKSENAFLFYALFIYRDCNFNVKWIEELEDCNYLEHVTQFAEENPEIKLSESTYSITPILDAILNEFEETSEEETSEEETSEDQTSEEQTYEEQTSEDQTYEEHTYEDHTSEEHTSEEHTSEEHTIPRMEIIINDYLNDNGDLFKKKFLDAVWEQVQGVKAHEHEIIITWNE